MNFYLTNAGLAAFVNPANTGTNAILIDRIGVSSVALPGDPEDHDSLLALPNELKRLSTFAGANVGDNTIHVTIRDESADTYALRTFGLYASTGVLMAYVTSAEPISQKTPSSMTLIAADLAFVVAINAQVNFGNTSFLNPPATTVTPGVVELATKEETSEGVDTTRAVTPYGLKWVLDQLLAGFAALVHNHDAAAIVSGVLQVGRIPALGMEKITGLAGALALKLDAASFTWNNLTGKPALVYPDTNVVFLTMQTRMATAANGSIYFGDQAIGARRLDFNGDLFKFVGASLQINGHTPWTTQNFNPVDKAAAIHSHDWAQVTGKPDLVINGQFSFQAGSGGSGYVILGAGDANTSGTIGFHSGTGVRYGYIGAATNGSKAIVFAAENGGSFYFGVRPNFGGAVPWDSANFNPADKAAALHSHDWAQITGKPSQVVSAQPSTTSEIDWNTLIAAGAYDVTPGAGWHANNPGLAYGYGQLLVTKGSASSVHQLYLAHNNETWLRQSYNGGWSTWRKLWDSLNFDPTTKATLGSAVNFFSLQAAEGGVGGRVKLGNQAGGTRELVYNGVNYYLNGADVYANGSKVWTAATFDPASKAALAHTHTTADITDLLDKFWPAGELRLYARTAPPAGVRVLAANGAAVSRTTYARLFAEFGTTFGAGDGATTFNLPDFRGVFFRGLDQGRGLDAGRALGVLQMSQNLAHTHSYLIPNGTDNTQAGSGVQGGFVQSGETTGSSGGTEARPINQALLACVTY